MINRVVMRVMRVRYLPAAAFSRVVERWISSKLAHGTRSSSLVHHRGRGVTSIWRISKAPSHQAKSAFDSIHAKVAGSKRFQHLEAVSHAYTVREANCPGNHIHALRTHI